MKYEFENLELLMANLEQSKPLSPEELSLQLAKEKERIITSFTRVSKMQFAKATIQEYVTFHSIELSELKYKAEQLPQSYSIIFIRCLNQLRFALMLNFPIESRSTQEKLIVTLNTEELALFVRLLYELGYIKNASRKAVATFFSNSIIVGKGNTLENFSASHFYNAMYTLKHKTLEEVSAIFRQCSKFLKDDLSKMCI
jgi:hypothetical protein